MKEIQNMWGFVLKYFECPNDSDNCNKTPMTQVHAASQALLISIPDSFAKKHCWRFKNDPAGTEND